MVEVGHDRDYNGGGGGGFCGRRVGVIDGGEAVGRGGGVIA